MLARSHSGALVRAPARQPPGALTPPGTAGSPGHACPPRGATRSRVLAATSHRAPQAPDMPPDLAQVAHLPATPRAPQTRAPDTGGSPDTPVRAPTAPICFRNLPPIPPTPSHLRPPGPRPAKLMLFR